MGYAATSIFWGVGPSFHAFNESRPAVLYCLPPVYHQLSHREYFHYLFGLIMMISA